MSIHRVKIRTALIARGVQEKDVLREIRSAVIPWRARIFENIRLFFGGDPFTAESQFIREVADCSSGSELDECFFNYRTNPDRRSRLTLLIFGLAPQRSRVFAFYKHLKSQKA